jgi:hypothetical protein
MSELRESNPLKKLIADRIFGSIKQLETDLLPTGDGINEVEVKRLSELRTQITVQRMRGSPLKPRHFTVQIIEHF